MIRTFAFVLIGAICSTAAWAGPQPEKASIVLRADVTIGATGRIESLAWEEQSPLHDMVARRAEGAVRSWQFEPGRIDGAPADTRTGLTIRVALEPVGDDLALQFEEATTGVVSVRTPPPAYPRHVARLGGQGTVAVTLDVAPDGSATVLDAVMLGDRQHAWRGKFIPAAREAAARWTFRPEVVGGRAVPSRVRVAVAFTLCDRCADTTSTRAAASSGGDPVALDSAVKLRTDIRAQDI